MKEKKKLILLGIILIAITITIGISFAIWQITLQQTDKNVITTGCFQIEFSDMNPIHLEKAYPITDEEGASLTPYEFTITNTCDSYASYQINLEILNSTTLTDLRYIKESLNETANVIKPKVLTTNETVTKTLEDAESSYKLEKGYLNAKESKTYNLRIWLGEETPTDSAYMNKTLNTKITVVTSYLKEKPKTPAEQNIEYIKTKATLNMIIEDDGTSDHNLRYIGANPNNYVYFNCDDNVNPAAETCELWRIIGMMNNIDDGFETKETRIKLIRNESIGSYSWDTSDSAINSGSGINEWFQADVMKLLNPGHNKESVGGSLYWNRESGTCYNGQNNTTTSCDFTKSGLKEDSKKIIGEAVWNTGANGRNVGANDLLTLKFYEIERSTNTGKICSSGSYCNDSVERTTTWKGMIGLMYPSDYGYATSGGTTTNRETCLNTTLYNWDNSNTSDCKANDWLYKVNTKQWTISPFSDPANADNVFRLYPAGRVSDRLAYDANAISPVLYLNSNVIITSGEGTELNPFILSME